MKELFLNHLQEKLNAVRKILEASNLDSLILDSGSPIYYFQDDQTMPFKPNPNFVFFCPDPGPDHLLQISKDGKPKLVFYSPDDFWHETSSLGTPFWIDGFDVEVCGKLEKRWDAINTTSGAHVYLGANNDCTNGSSLKLPSREFVSALHWCRTQKSEYEVECIRRANEIAAKGHMAAKSAFLSGCSEKEISYQYIQATGLSENQLPYHCITALDEKAAVLHYHGARETKNGKVFLIDAGATYQGYCSDITRTYASDKADPLFHELINGLEKIQKNVSVQVLPGFNYPDLHQQASRNIGKLLKDCQILQNCSLDEIEDKDLVYPFFPHGLGHPLGIQVHDVGGKQMDSQGTQGEPDSKYPHLRTLRQIQENDVVTIEPGVYFIPMLLNPLRDDTEVKNFMNWPLIDTLFSHGGIRIEDNIVAKSSGPLNLTREFLN